MLSHNSQVCTSPLSLPYPFSQQTQDTDEAALNKFRQKVEKYRLQTVGMPLDDPSHRNYKNMREEMNRKTQRVEMIVLKKIITDHADATFSEFKVVLVGILDNARFECSLQRAFHGCIGQDMYRLKQRQLQISQHALCPAISGLPPWVPLCAGCKGRLSEKTHVPAYMCNHVFHRECAVGRDGQVSLKCPICFGRSRKQDAAKGGPAKDEAKASAEGGALNKKLERRLNSLSMRLRNKRLQEFLASLHMAPGGDDDDAEAAEAVQLPLPDTAPASYLQDILEYECADLPPPPPSIVPGKLSEEPEFDEELYCELDELIDDAILCD